MSGLDLCSRQCAFDATSKQQFGRLGLSSQHNVSRPSCLPNKFDSKFTFPMYFQWIPVFNANGPRRRHSSGGRTIRKIHTSRENDQKQFGKGSERGPENASTAWINVGRQHCNGIVLHCTFGAYEGTWQQIECSHPTGDGQRRMCVAVHDLHERILHRTEAEHRARCVCIGQSNDIAAARLWHHWRPVLTITANRWPATVFIGESIKSQSNDNNLIAFNWLLPFQCIDSGYSYRIHTHASSYCCRQQLKLITVPLASVIANSLTSVTYALFVSPVSFSSLKWTATSRNFKSCCFVSFPQFSVNLVRFAPHASEFSIDWLYCIWTEINFNLIFFSTVFKMPAPIATKAKKKKIKGWRDTCAFFLLRYSNWKCSLFDIVSKLHSFHVLYSI